MISAILIIAVVVAIYWLMWRGRKVKYPLFTPSTKSGDWTESRKAMETLSLAGS